MSQREILENNNILGIIAGNGKFPIMLAQKATHSGYSLVVAGIKGDTSSLMRFAPGHFSLFGPGEMRKILDYFKKHGVKKVVMVGQVSPSNLFDKKVKIDEEFEKIFQSIENRKADTIFNAIAQKLKENGMELTDSTFLLNEHLAPKGTLTKRGPTLSELDDISFGQEIAKQMGEIDVGQTVVVKEKAIVAIEAMEGTNKAILRGGVIARSGAVVVKMSKPKQDFRFDVPVVGPQTIKIMASVKASCLAVESQKTLMIDREQCVRLANRSGICIVAV